MAESKASLFHEIIGLAAGCGASPTQILTVALASIHASTVDEALDALLARRGDIARAVADTPTPHCSLAAPPAGPPLARMRLEIGDHELRERLVFDALLGEQRFMQVVALAVAGVELSESDAELVEQLLIASQVADPRIWPLAVTRRLARFGAPFESRVLGGVASMLNPYMGAKPCAAFVALLDRVHDALARGMSVDAWLDDVLASGELLPGFGRPVIRGVDERVPHYLEIARNHGRLDCANVRVVLELDKRLSARKGIRVNAAGVITAILCDLGFSAAGIGGIIQLCLTVPVLMHACLVTAGEEERV